MHRIPPIRRQLVVPVGADLAFSVFADEIGAWWPVGEGYSVFGAGSMVSVKDGRVVEIGPDGSEAVWGTILDWEPPRRLRMTWHPGKEPQTSSEVEVRFAEITDGRTLVTLEHRGWEALAQPAETQRGYFRGWPVVLGHFHGLASQNQVEAGAGDVWFALFHTPGAAIGEGQRIFSHPDFPEHLAFLRALRDEGLLVAAGPIDDAGEGMAVVRLPDPGGAAELVRRAQEDDLSVARGVLLVRVRPWHVALTAHP